MILNIYIILIGFLKIIMPATNEEKLLCYGYYKQTLQKVIILLINPGVFN